MNTEIQFVRKADETWTTIKEASKRYGLNPNFLRLRSRKDPSFPPALATAYTVGKARFYNRADLDEWVLKQNYWRA